MNVVLLHTFTPRMTVPPRYSQLLKRVALPLGTAAPPHNSGIILLAESLVFTLVPKYHLILVIVTRGDTSIMLRNPLA